MSPTRRSLLGSLSLSAVAGCLTAETRTDGDPSEPADVSGTSTDPTFLTVRNPDGDAVVIDGADGSRSVTRELVTSPERAAELTAAEGVTDADRSRIRTFLEETDYATETVYVAPASIEACYRFRIHSVSWDPGRVDYEYCRELRPPDASCESERRHAVGIFFRLPVALETPLNGSGAGGRSPCRRVETDYERVDANATVTGPTTVGNDTDGDRS